jgi:hypothetical protein
MPEGESRKKKMMTVSRDKDFTERLVKICFARHCSGGKRAEHLSSVAEEPKKRFPLVCT